MKKRRTKNKIKTKEKGKKLVCNLLYIVHPRFCVRLLAKQKYIFAGTITNIIITDDMKCMTKSEQITFTNGCQHSQSLIREGSLLLLQITWTLIILAVAWFSAIEGRFSCWSWRANLLIPFSFRFFIFGTFFHNRIHGQLTRVKE